MNRYRDEMGRFAPNPYNQSDLDANIQAMQARLAELQRLDRAELEARNRSLDAVNAIMDEASNIQWDGGGPDSHQAYDRIMTFRAPTEGNYTVTMPTLERINPVTREVPSTWREVPSMAVPVATPFDTELPSMPPPPTVNMEYVRTLLANAGVREDQIPTSTVHDWARNEDKRVINQAFFQWYKAHTEGVQTTSNYSERDSQLFKSVLTPQTSQEYQSILREIQRSHEAIVARFRDINNLLQVIGDKRERKLLIEGRASVDLTSEVNEITKDGWYQYDSTATHTYNEGQYANRSGLVFKTPRIFIKYYNKDAGIDMSVDLGMFQVIYRPQASSLTVQPAGDNVEFEGYHHPHVSTQGDVCWGNAATTYATSMSEAKPSRAMLALRTLLVTYNDDNPFVDISGFMIARDPTILETMPLSYGVYDQLAWIADHNLPSSIMSSDIRDSRSDFMFEDADDETEASLVRLYVQRRGPIRVDRNQYFVRVSNSSSENGFAYREIDEHDIEWES